jgi:glycosyltransferase involved in cell wall biosynthesis
MISVVVATLNNQADLVDALALLVPASMDGLVRELVVADAGSGDATLEIADEAGAVVVSGGQADGIAKAKGPWILLITPASRLGPDWLALAKDHMTRFPDRPATFTRRGWFAKPQGVLAPKALAEQGRLGRAKVLRLA